MNNSDIYVDISKKIKPYFSNRICKQWSACNSRRNNHGKSC